MWWLYLIVGGLLLVSLWRSRTRTERVLCQAFKSVKKIMMWTVMIIVIVGMMLAFLSPAMISASLGGSSGVMGVVLGLVLGSVAHVPSFVAFPMSARLLEQGAAYPPVGSFLVTLMGISLTSLPLELSYFGRRVTVMRHVMCVVIACAFAILLWVVNP